MYTIPYKAVEERGTEYEIVTLKNTCLCQTKEGDIPHGERCYCTDNTKTLGITQGYLLFINPSFQDNLE